MRRDIVLGVLLGVALSCIAIAMEYPMFRGIMRYESPQNQTMGMVIVGLYGLCALIQLVIGVILGIAIPNDQRKRDTQQPNVRTVLTQVADQQVGTLPLAKSRSRKKKPKALLTSSEENYRDNSSP